VTSSDLSCSRVEAQSIGYEDPASRRTVLFEMVLPSCAGAFAAAFQKRQYARLRARFHWKSRREKMTIDASSSTPM
jgi:hypothetical protein